MNTPYGSHFLSGVPEVKAAYTFALEDALRTALLGSYNIFVRPLVNVNVTIALNIITLNKLVSISKVQWCILNYIW